MLEQIPPFDHFHGEEPFVGVVNQLIELDKVRVTESGERTELAFESVQGLGGHVPERLERNDGLVAQIPDGVHHPERASAQPTLDDEPRRSAKLGARHAPMIDGLKERSTMLLHIPN